MLSGCEDDNEASSPTPWLRRLSEAWQKENCPLLGSQRKLLFSCRNKSFSSWVELTTTGELSEAWNELWQFEHVNVLRVDVSLRFVAVMFLITRWKTLKDITDEIVDNLDPSCFDTGCDQLISAETDCGKWQGRETHWHTIQQDEDWKIPNFYLEYRVRLAIGILFLYLVKVSVLVFCRLF